MGKRVAIIQSSYIPWKGYFDIIRGVDEFVLLDDAQYTRRDWRNRNIIKTPGGPQWLTIPVETKGRFDAPIELDPHCSRVGGEALGRPAPCLRTGALLCPAGSAHRGDVPVAR